MKKLISNRVFRIVMASDLLQQLAIWLRNMALLYFVMEQTNGNPVAVSLLTVVEYAPILIFSVVGGLLADRWRPKQTMIWGDVLSFLSVLAIIAAVSAGYWQAIFVTAAVSAIVSQFSQPSSMKIFKQHIPEDQVGSAMGIAQSLSSLFIIVGPIIGTGLYFAMGIQASLISLLLVFALSAAVLAFLPSDIKHTAQQADSHTTLRQDWIEGFRYIRSKPHLLLLFTVLSAMAAGVGLIQPLEIFLVTERLQLPQEALQWLSAAAGIGMLAGSILAALPATQRLNRTWVLFAGLFVLGLSTIVEALSIWPVLTVGMRLITGIFLAMMQTILATVLITSVDEAYIGRVNGLFVPIFTGSMLLGTAVSGWLVVQTSLVAVFCISGVLLVVISFVSLRLKLAQPSA